MTVRMSLCAACAVPDERASGDGQVTWTVSTAVALVRGVLMQSPTAAITTPAWTTGVSAAASPTGTRSSPRGP